MHREQRSVIYAALLLALAPAPLGAASFVYEGQLDDHGEPANGRYDIQLAVYRDADQRGDRLDAELRQHGRRWRGTATQSGRAVLQRDRCGVAARPGAG